MTSSGILTRLTDIVHLVHVRPGAPDDGALLYLRINASLSPIVAGARFSLSIIPLGGARFMHSMYRHQVVLDLCIVMDL